MNANVIEEQAAQWILRCDRGEDTPADRAAFETWLAADARHRAAYLRLEKTWQRSEGLKAWKPHDGALDAGVLASRPARRRLAVAAVFALIAIAGPVWFVLAPSGATTYATDTGGYQRLVLADGSVVQLNTDSKIDVRLTADRREVRLVRGEAYFDIAHDARRPFDVLAAGTVVRALGTAFSVRLREREQVEVIVAHGSVAVASHPEAAPLVAGQTVIAKPDGLAVARLERPELSRRLAWQTGQLAFQGQALATVVAEFNRYNRRRVEIADPALEKLEVAGSFKATDLNSFVAAMHRALNVRIEETEESVRLFAH